MQEGTSIYGNQAEILWPERPNYGEPKRGLRPATAYSQLIEVPKS